MNKVSYLGELEQMLLWTILRLGDRAYGLAIRDELEATAGRATSRGTVYITLDRLVSKGYLETWLGDAADQRAGRARRYFSVTREGREALARSRQALVRLWSGLESTVGEGS